MSSTELQNAQEVVQWVEQNNGFWNSDLLEIKPSKFGGVGVFAKKDHDPVLRPTVLLRLHKQSLLSFQKSAVANLITDEGIDGALALIISFIYEKKSGKSSPWYPFIKSIQYKDENGNLILPPSLWSKKQKEILKGTELDIMGALDDQENQDAYERACSFALSQSEATNGLIEIPWEFDIEGIEDEKVFEKYKTFIAISHAIASRDFEIDEYHQVGLVPGACLFNHSNKPTVRFESLFDVCVACGVSDGCDHIVDGSDEESSDDEGLSGDEGMSDDESPHYHHGHDSEEAEEAKDDNTDEESSDEEEFDGPIEEFIDIIEAAILQEKEEEQKQNENDDDHEEGDSSLELENEVIIEDDGHPVSPDDCCDIVLMRQVKRGDELFNTYGDFSNSILLSKYGFVIPGNINDTVGLGLQFLKLRKNNKKLYSRQFDWWEKEGHVLMSEYLNTKKNACEDDHDHDHDHDHEDCGDDGCNEGCCGGNEEEVDDIPNWSMDVNIQHTGEPTPITYALLKLLSLNKVELTRFLKNPEKLNLEILTTKSSLSLKIYKELVTARLKEYTEQNLTKLLKSADPRTKLAAQLVLDEKEILHRALKYIEKKV